MKHGFFAVDRRAWARACSIGLNSAAAYLVLACGTGGDNRTTRWSNNAVEKYTGLSRGRAAAAVKELIQAGLLRVDEAGTRPRYYLPPPHLIPGCEGHLPTLSADETVLLAEMDPEYTYRFTNRRSQGRSQSDLELASSLVQHGLLSRNSDGRFSLLPYDAAKAAEPDWIWLPNTIVTGAATEDPPVVLLRQTQNTAAMRLFVDCYHSHALAEDGGIHWRRIRRGFTRHKVGERGSYIVWGFQESTSTAWPNAPFVAAHLTGQVQTVSNADGSKRSQDSGFPVFWESWSMLAELGLTEMVPHIVEADTGSAEIIHPYAIASGEPGEHEIALAAHSAGASLLTTSQVEWARDHSLWLLPSVAGRFPNLQMVGIYRMRYRPQTKATAAWIANRDDWGEWTRRYRSLAEAAAA